MTGEQGGPDVVPPYAAYAPPGTPQVGLGYPLPTAMAQLPLVPSSAAPILTPRAVEAKCLNWGSAPTQNLLASTLHYYCFCPSLSHSTNTNGPCSRPGLLQSTWTQSAEKTRCDLVLGS